MGYVGGREVGVGDGGRERNGGHILVWPSTGFPSDERRGGRSGKRGGGYIRGAHLTEFLLNAR